MSCCAPTYAFAETAETRSRANEVLLASRVVGTGLRQTDLSVPGIHCGGCIERIEKSIGALPGVEQARVNLSTKRVTIRWRDNADPTSFIEALSGLGYACHLYDTSADAGDRPLKELVRALAVAGFAAGNIMLLSVSVWSGADPTTRDIFHWISALIALFALAYSGSIFFRSAWSALRHGHTNMDVPISIGIVLAFGMSLYETVHHGEHAYFDAAVSLLFFLLIGRTLDYMMRERARVAVKGLARLAARGAMVIEPDGAHTYLPINEIAPGMTILLAAGERVPVDARILSGRSDLDCSLVNGESLPLPVGEGAVLQAGTLNLTAPLTLEATAAAKDSFLAEMVRMMEAAEAGRSGYRRIADRAARLYAPVVHTTATLTFLGWFLATGDAHRAITIAIAVLIITCPCALGLAVPMVQVVAARRLFERGIMLKDGGALERLAEIDTVVFDKTGTLTLGMPRLVNSDTIDPEALATAVAIAAHSRHPYSRALASAKADIRIPLIVSAAVAEHPGSGLEARLSSGTYRLGRPDWAIGSANPSTPDASSANVVLSRDGQLIAAFAFDEQLREGTGLAIADLRRMGFAVEILSGDHDEAVRRIAEAFDIPYVANMSPADKATHIGRMQASGRKPLLVGDGLNDAPALVAAHASMAPASGADVGRNAAGLIFMHESLTAVPTAVQIARSAGRLVRQNLALAAGYNAIAVPVAIFGHVTPLVAAIAMSLSSLAVVANALRLQARKQAAAPSRHLRLASPQPVAQ